MNRPIAQHTAIQSQQTVRLPSDQAKLTRARSGALPSGNQVKFPPGPLLKSMTATTSGVAKENMGKRSPAESSKTFIGTRGSPLSQVNSDQKTTGTSRPVLQRGRSDCINNRSKRRPSLQRSQAERQLPTKYRKASNRRAAVKLSTQVTRDFSQEELAMAAKTGISPQNGATRKWSNGSVNGSQQAQATEKSPPDLKSNLQGCIGQIGDYGVPAKGLKLPDDVYKNVLMKGIEDPTAPADQSERETFLTDLADRLESLQGPSDGGTIKMEDLLGKDLLKQYKKAIKEETKDPKFREAVFNKSTKALDKSPASLGQKMVMFIGGPSASGKTFAQGKFVDHLAAQQKDSGTYEPQFLVSSDGGNERELSQMRQMVLQAAVDLGYDGIEDLHNNTSLGMKGLVRKAAMKADNNVHVAMPLTFTNPKHLLLLKLGSKSNVTPVFAMVAQKPGSKANFQETVKFNGESRAFLQNEGDRKKHRGQGIRMNNTDLPESKKYNAKYFQDGVDASNRALKMFQAAFGKEGSVLKLESDNMHVSKDENGNYDQVTSQVEVKHIAERELKLWESLDDSVSQRSRGEKFEQWLTDNKLPTHNAEGQRYADMLGGDTTIGLKEFNSLLMKNGLKAPALITSS